MRVDNLAQETRCERFLLFHGTSTVFNFYTGLKFMSKTHFYGRIAAEGILAITYENRPFYGRRAAEAIFSV